MYLENNQVKKYPVRMILAWSTVVVWMGFIFAFSHQPAEQSALLSQQLADMLMRSLKIQAESGMITQLDQVLRSLADGILYLILSLLVSWAFSESGIAILSNALLSFIVCALYAASDELHKAFIPGREGHWYPYLISLAGLVMGIVLYQLVSTLRYLRQDLEVRREEDLRL
ncbi:MAG: VanZ family protein [Ruminococcaceae bacterium]|nr:VanZ family protein [Oscillospiraceae bacterium]